MTEYNEPKTIGLTKPTQEKLRRLMENEHFKEMQDGYKFAVGLACHGLGENRNCDIWNGHYTGGVCFGAFNQLLPILAKNLDPSPADIHDTAIDIHIASF